MKIYADYDRWDESPFTAVFPMNQRDSTQSSNSARDSTMPCAVKLKSSFKTGLLISLKRSVISHIDSHICILRQKLVFTLQIGYHLLLNLNSGSLSCKSKTRVISSKSQNWFLSKEIWVRPMSSSDFSTIGQSVICIGR